MNRLHENPARHRILGLAALLACALVASCGDDDPAAPPATNRAPAAPAVDTASGAPAHGAVDVGLGVELHWTCSDPDGDPLAFTVHFGTEAEPPAVAQDHAATSYTPAPLVPATTYNWRIVAKDDGGRSTAGPVWNFTTAAASPETVDAPGAPSLPATAETNQNLTITVGGGASSMGHTLQYRLDYGDGDVSSWFAAATAAQHAWTTAATWQVTAQARCLNHPDIESAWSAAAEVVVSEPVETITSPPGTINGVTAGAVDEAYGYDAFHGAQTSLGDPVEWRFEWGDGTYTEWSTATTHTAAHAWSTAGTYTVVYHVRCTVHTDLTAASAPLAVTISETAIETVGTPGYVNWGTDPRNPVTGSTVSYTSYGGTSSLGHDVETRFDWGDGTAFSDWAGDFAAVAKTWPTVGTYTMRRQSRCIEHPDVISAWGGDTPILVRDPETVSAPDAPDGPAVGIRYQYLYYVASGAASSWNHSTAYLEYRYDWGDGTALSAWSQSETNRRHQYTTLGTYEVRTQARCVVSLHDPIESAWSAPATVDIVEVVTVGYVSGGPDFAAVGESNDFTLYNSRSDVGHALEYQVDWADGTVSDWDPATVVTHAWTAAGAYDVVFRARCVEHTDAVSAWSSAHTVDVTANAEEVSTPVASHSASGNVTVGTEVWVSGNDAIDNFGHLLEYRIDFGDGAVSDWTAASYTYGNSHLSLQHAYAASGTYAVAAQARCADHPGIESAWSAPHELVVHEAINFDGPPTGPLTGTVGESLVYSTPGATSTDGHALEYRFIYLRGYTRIATGGWSTSPTDAHVFTSAHTQYAVQVEARCATDTTITRLSDYLQWIVISP